MIVGGGIAGTTAAETIRQKDNDSSIALISLEPHFLYSRVLLPEFVKGEVGIDKVMLRSAADYQKNRIEVFLEEKIISLNLEERFVETDSGRKFEFKKLLLASGGEPEAWAFEKEAPESVFRLQTLEDAKKIIAFFEEKKSGEALVVGGGFIALELIEILAQKNFKTMVLCREKSLWGGLLDSECLDFLLGIWAGRGISFAPEDEVRSLKKEGDEVSVLTEKGRGFKSDFVGVGIGIKRDLSRLEASLPSGGIKVNEHLETGFPSVWAAGDAVDCPDLITGQRRLCRTWSEAFMQGRIAGLNMTGASEVFKMVPTYSIGHIGQVITFVGDIFSSGGPFNSASNVLTAVPKKKEGEYVRISEEGGVIKGAVMINAQAQVGRMSKAVLNRETVEEYLRKS